VTPLNIISSIKRRFNHKDESAIRKEKLHNYYDELGRTCEFACDYFFSAFEVHKYDMDDPRNQLIFARICILIYRERNKFVECFTGDLDGTLDPYTVFTLAKDRILYDWRVIAAKCYTSEDYLRRLCNLIEAEVTK
jgi:hypothetical protein